jgi:hypothetical protein
MKFWTAIALLGGTVAAAPAGNQTDNDLVKRATSFWYANMDHTGSYRGYAPDLDGDYSYAVYVSATAGDGSSIQRAINAGTNGATRHPEWLASQPRVRHSRVSRQEFGIDALNRLSTSLLAPILSARLSR